MSNAGTDGDGFSDGEEVAQGADPVDDTSFPILADGDLTADGTLHAADPLWLEQILMGQRLLTPLLVSDCDVVPQANGIPSCKLGDMVVIQRMILAQ